METVAYKPLKLLAKSVVDLEVLSACLQDALVPLQGMQYDSTLKRFSIVVGRYRWEAIQADNNSGERIHSGVLFDNVEKIEFSGFDPVQSAKIILQLLTVQHLPPYVHMTFADNIKIRLTISTLTVKLRDSDQPAWPALRPQHEG